MNPAKSSWKPIVAGLLAGAYGFTQVGGAYAAEASLWENRRAARAAQFAALPAPQPLPGAALIAAAPALPARAQAALGWLAELATPQGELREVHLGAPGAPLVILVQDLHEVEEAQRRQGAFLKALAASGRVRLVGTEGAMGAYDLSPYRELPEPTRSRLGEVFMDLGYFTGPEAAAVASPSAFALWGVEDAPAYTAHIAAFAAAEKTRTGLLEDLTALTRDSDGAARRIFSPALAAFDAARAAYHDGRQGLGEYVVNLWTILPDGDFPQAAALRRVLDAERRLDFAQVEADRRRLVDALGRRLSERALRAVVQESMRYRAGTLSAGAYHSYLRALCAEQGVALTPAIDGYIAYVLQAERLDRDGLMAELDRMETAAEAALAKTAEEKSLAAARRRLSLLTKLARHQMTPADWARYEATPGVNPTAALTALLGRSPQGAGAMARDLKPFEDFCRLALARNAALSRNLLEKMRAEKAPAAALVAGGFHTAGLTALLKRAGASYAVFTPRIGALPKDHEGLGIFTRAALPLEKLLAGESLHLGFPHYLNPAARALPEAAARFAPVPGAAAAMAPALANTPAERAQVESLLETLKDGGKSDRAYTELEGGGRAFTYRARLPKGATAELTAVVTEDEGFFARRGLGDGVYARRFEGPLFLRVYPAGEVRRKTSVLTRAQAAAVEAGQKVSGAAQGLLSPARARAGLLLLFAGILSASPPTRGQVGSFFGQWDVLVGITLATAGLVVLSTRWSPLADFHPFAALRRWFAPRQDTQGPVIRLTGGALSGAEHAALNRSIAEDIRAGRAATLFHDRPAHHAGEKEIKAMPAGAPGSLLEALRERWHQSAGKALRLPAGFDVVVVDTPFPGDAALHPGRGRGQAYWSKALWDGLSQVYAGLATPTHRRVLTDILMDAFLHEAVHMRQAESPEEPMSEVEVERLAPSARARALFRAIHAAPVAAKLGISLNFPSLLGRSAGERSSYLHAFLGATREEGLSGQDHLRMSEALLEKVDGKAAEPLNKILAQWHAGAALSRSRPGEALFERTLEVLRDGEALDLDPETGAPMTGQAMAMELLGQNELTENSKDFNRLNVVTDHLDHLEPWDRGGADRAGDSVLLPRPGGWTALPISLEELKARIQLHPKISEAQKSVIIRRLRAAKNGQGRISRADLDRLGRPLMEWVGGGRSAGGRGSRYAEERFMENGERVVSDKAKGNYLIPIDGPEAPRRSILEVGLAQLRAQNLATGKRVDLDLHTSHLTDQDVKGELARLGYKPLGAARLVAPFRGLLRLEGVYGHDAPGAPRVRIFRVRKTHLLDAASGDFYKHAASVGGQTPPDWRGLYWPDAHDTMLVDFVLSGRAHEALEEGRFYQFVANLDNLAALPDPALLAMLWLTGKPMMNELAAKPRGAKGGSAMKFKEGQVPPSLDFGQRRGLLEEFQIDPAFFRESSKLGEYFPLFNSANYLIDIIEYTRGAFLSPEATEAEVRDFLRGFHQARNDPAVLAQRQFDVLYGLRQRMRSWEKDKDHPADQPAFLAGAHTWYMDVLYAEVPEGAEGGSETRFEPLKANLDNVLRELDLLARLKAEIGAELWGDTVFEGVPEDIFENHPERSHGAQAGHLLHLKEKYKGESLASVEARLGDQAAAMEASLARIAARYPRAYFDGTTALIGHTADPSWARDVALDESADFSAGLDALAAWLRERLASPPAGDAGDALRSMAETLQALRAAGDTGTFYAPIWGGGEYALGLGLGAPLKLGLAEAFFLRDSPLFEHRQEALFHELFHAAEPGRPDVHEAALRLQAVLFWGLNPRDAARLPLAQLENHPRNGLGRAIRVWRLAGLLRTEPGGLARRRAEGLPATDDNVRILRDKIRSSLNDPPAVVQLLTELDDASRAALPLRPATLEREAARLAGRIQLLKGEPAEGAKNPDVLQEARVSLADWSAPLLPAAPVEAVQPLLKAVALLEAAEEKALLEIVDKAVRDEPALHRRPMFDRIFLMAGRVPKDWARLQGIVLRWVVRVSAEARKLWRGGLGPVQTFHSDGMVELVGPGGVEIMEIEPDYAYTRDAAGQLVPVDDNKPSTQLDIETGVQYLDIPFHWQGSTTIKRVRVRLARGPLGNPVYLWRDEGEYFTKTLYDYSQRENPVSVEEFSAFQAVVTLAILADQADKREAEAARLGQAGPRAPPFINTNDAQTSLVNVLVSELDNRNDRGELNNPVLRALRTNFPGLDRLRGRAATHFTTHTYFNRIYYDAAGWARQRLEQLSGIAAWDEWKQNRVFGRRGPSGRGQLDLSTGGLMSSGGQSGVTRKHARDVRRLYDPDANVVGIANGMNMEWTARVFRAILQRLFGPAADPLRPAPAQVRQAKVEAKKLFFHTLLNQDGRAVDEMTRQRLQTILADADAVAEQAMVGYIGRLVPEKFDMGRLWTLDNIRAMVDEGANVVILGLLQPSDSRSVHLKGELLKMQALLDAEWTPGKGRLLFLHHFESEVKNHAMPPLDILALRSDKDTEANGFTEVGASASGALVLAPPHFDGEGLIAGQGIPVDFSEPGWGNTLIPDADRAASYRDVLVAALRHRRENPLEFAAHQAASVRLSRILDTKLTAAGYLIQWNQEYQRPWKVEVEGDWRQAIGVPENRPFEFAARVFHRPGTPPETLEARIVMAPVPKNSDGGPRWGGPWGAPVYIPLAADGSGTTPERDEFQRFVFEGSAEKLAALPRGAYEFYVEARGVDGRWVLQQNLRPGENGKLDLTPPPAGAPSAPAAIPAVGAAVVTTLALAIAFFPAPVFAAMGAPIDPGGWLGALGAAALAVAVVRAAVVRWIKGRRGQAHWHSVDQIVGLIERRLRGLPSAGLRLTPEGEGLARTRLAELKELVAAGPLPNGGATDLVRTVDYKNPGTDVFQTTQGLVLMYFVHRVLGGLEPEKNPFTVGFLEKLGEVVRKLIVDTVAAEHHDAAAMRARLDRAMLVLRANFDLENFDQNREGVERLWGLAATDGDREYAGVLSELRGLAEDRWGWTPAAAERLVNTLAPALDHARRHGVPDSQIWVEASLAVDSGERRVDVWNWPAAGLPPGLDREFYSPGLPAVSGVAADVSRGARALQDLSVYGRVHFSWSRPDIDGVRPYVRFRLSMPTWQGVPTPPGAGRAGSSGLGRFLLRQAVDGSALAAARAWLLRAFFETLMMGQGAAFRRLGLAGFQPFYLSVMPDGPAGSRGGAAPAKSIGMTPERRKRLVHFAKQLGAEKNVMESELPEIHALMGHVQHDGGKPDWEKVRVILKGLAKYGLPANNLATYRLYLQAFDATNQGKYEEAADLWLKHREVLDEWIKPGVPPIVFRPSITAALPEILQLAATFYGYNNARSRALLTAAQHYLALGQYTPEERAASPSLQGSHGLSLLVEGMLLVRGEDGAPAPNPVEKKARLERAVGLFQEAGRYLGNTPMPAAQLAGAYLRLGRHREMRRTLAPALQKWPDAALLHGLAAQSRIHLAEQAARRPSRRAQAEALYREALVFIDRALAATYLVDFNPELTMTTGIHARLGLAALTADPESRAHVEAADKLLKKIIAESFKQDAFLLPLEIALEQWMLHQEPRGGQAAVLDLMLTQRGGAPGEAFLRAAANAMQNVVKDPEVWLTALLTEARKPGNGRRAAAIALLGHLEAHHHLAVVAREALDQKNAETAVAVFAALGAHSETLALDEVDAIAALARGDKRLPALREADRARRRESWPERAAEVLKASLPAQPQNSSKGREAQREALEGVHQRMQGILDEAKAVGLTSLPGTFGERFDVFRARLEKIEAKLILAATELDRFKKASIDKLVEKGDRERLIALKGALDEQVKELSRAEPSPLDNADLAERVARARENIERGIAFVDFEPLTWQVSVHFLIVRLTSMTDERFPEAHDWLEELRAVRDEARALAARAEGFPYPEYFAERVQNELNELDWLLSDLDDAVAQMEKSGRWPWLQSFYDRVSVRSGWGVGQAAVPALVESLPAAAVVFALTPLLDGGIFSLGFYTLAGLSRLAWMALHRPGGDWRSAFSADKWLITGGTFFFLGLSEPLWSNTAAVWQAVVVAFAFFFPHFAIDGYRAAAREAALARVSAEAVPRRLRLLHENLLGGPAGPTVSLGWVTVDEAALRRAVRDQRDAGAWSRAHLQFLLEGKFDEAQIDDTDNLFASLGRRHRRMDGFTEHEELATAFLYWASRLPRGLSSADFQRALARIAALYHRGMGVYGVEERLAEAARTGRETAMDVSRAILAQAEGTAAALSKSETAQWRRLEAAQAAGNPFYVLLPEGVRLHDAAARAFGRRFPDARIVEKNNLKTDRGLYSVEKFLRRAQNVPIGRLPDVNFDLYLLDPGLWTVERDVRALVAVLVEVMEGFVAEIVDFDAQLRHISIIQSNA